jgi:adenylate kinase family enzyme
MSFDPVGTILVRRVLIIGCSGAGKSTFAAKLARETKLPLIHLDREFWHAGWVETPRSEWRARVTELVADESWIMEGNYGSCLISGCRVPTPSSGLTIPAIAANGAS